MELLHELTINNLKLNKKRSIATIIGIMLSVALIFTVLSGVTSFRETLKNNAINEYGDYHIYTSDSKVFDKIKAHKNFQSSYQIKTIGYSDLDTVSYFKKYLIFKSMSKDAFDKNNLKLVEGRFPKSADEIIVNKASKAFLNNDLKLNIPYNFPLMEITEKFDQEGNSSIEKKQIGNKTFKVVGFIENPNSSIEDMGQLGFVALSLDEGNSDFIEETIYFKVKNTREINQTTKDIFTEGTTYYDNISLLRTDGIGLSDSSMNVFYGIAAVIIAIIVFTSVSVIRNSFSISIVEKTKQYGILKSQGATDKQIRNDIYFEAFTLGFIGITLGLILGYIATKIVIYTIYQISKEFFDDSIYLVSKFSFLGLALAIALALLIIFLSSSRIAWRVKRFSPIEAIRGSKDIKISQKEVKTPRYIENLFGFAGVVSYKNLKRNSKKYRTTIISLVTSVAVFISASYLIATLKDSQSLQFDNTDANISVFSYNGNFESAYQDMKKLKDQVLKDEEYSLAKKFGILVDQKHLNNSDKEDGLQEEVMLKLILLDDNSFEKTLEENKLDPSVKFFTTNKTKRYIEDKTYKVELLKDMSFTASLENIDMFETNDNVNNLEKKEFKIDLSLIKDTPFGYSEYGLDTIDIFAKESDFEKNLIPSNTSSTLYVKSDNPDKLEKDIHEYATNNKLVNFNINNKDKENRSLKALILTLQLLVYGLVLVLTAIGITNIFNTITANMQSRKVEFATLKSAGMDSNDFIKMNRLESFFLGSKAFIIGLVIGLILTALIYLSLKNKYEMPYKLPLLGIALSLVFVFALIRIIMAYSSSKLKNINIIETIRNENI